jgi:hypothetical protein
MAWTPRCSPKPSPPTSARRCCPGKCSHAGRVGRARAPQRTAPARQSGLGALRMQPCSTLLIRSVPRWSVSGVDCPRHPVILHGMLEPTVLLAAVVHVPNPVQVDWLQQRGARAGGHCAGPAAAARTARVPGNIPRPCSPDAPAPQALHVSMQDLSALPARYTALGAHVSLAHACLRVWW